MCSSTLRVALVHLLVLRNQHHRSDTDHKGQNLHGGLLQSRSLKELGKNGDGGDVNETFKNREEHQNNNYDTVKQIEVPYLQP